jgi:predicted membrane protein
MIKCCLLNRFIYSFYKRHQFYILSHVFFFIKRYFYIFSLFGCLINCVRYLFWCVLHNRRCCISEFERRSPNVIFNTTLNLFCDQHFAMYDLNSQLKSNSIERNDLIINSIVLDYWFLSLKNINMLHMLQTDAINFFKFMINSRLLNPG